MLTRLLFAQQLSFLLPLCVSRKLIQLALRPLLFSILLKWHFRLDEAWPPLALTFFDFLPLRPVKPFGLLIGQSVLSQLSLLRLA